MDKKTMIIKEYMKSIQQTANFSGNAATLLYVLTIILQLLLASGILPITMAWGGREPVLTTNLRIASLASAAFLLIFIYIIRRRAGLVGDAPVTPIIKVLSWLITGFSALNFLGILASLSNGEKILFGPISFLLLVSCILVSISKPTSQVSPNDLAPAP
jgi:hypothetical protein